MNACLTQLLWELESRTYNTPTACFPKAAVHHDCEGSFSSLNWESPAANPFAYTQ